MIYLRSSEFSDAIYASYPHVVQLEMPTTYWEDENWVAKKNVMVANFNEWLLENFTDRSDAYFVFSKCSSSNGNHSFFFHFREKSMAILFKLRWV